MYDVYGPPNRRQPPAQRGAGPTLEDYQALRTAYLELKVSAETLAKDLEARKSEIAIQKDALHKQGEDLKKTQSELMWTKAALQAAEAANAEPDRESWQDRYTRLQAEVENLRRRWEQRSTHEIGEARRDILRDMLPLADHLELALQHADALRTNPAGSSFVGNIESTLRAFLDTLRRYGVELQEPIGKPFDPEQYEAVGQVVAHEIPPGHVAHVVQSGYTEGERLLRPARVIVSQERAA